MRELPQNVTPPANGDANETEHLYSRRFVLSGAGAMTLLGMAGCSTSTLELPQFQLDDTVTGSVRPIRPAISVDKNVTGPDVMYASLNDGGFEVPAVPYQKVKPEFRRQIVVNETGEAPGTIVVHLQERKLYLVQEGGDAIRYGVGIGKDGFRWSGRANIQYGKEWPTWTPPPEMRARQRGLPIQMAGGEGNPLGARAMYLGSTLYRIHGSNDPDSIGQAESSGCFRMTNDDVKDLYERVAIGTTVIVR
jgi:lipoprotein-anchoring transpeptidase ErfK/SrfK